jgi:glucose-6-phosphate 1-dehydrogenase
MVLRLDNFTIVIFGASGDLTARKLMPSIYELAKVGALPQRYRIIGVDRVDFDDQSFREIIKEKVGKLSPDSVTDPAHFDEFCREHIFYIKGSFDNKQTFASLAQNIKAVEDRQGMCDNLLYYLATPPVAAPLIVNGLESAGLGGRAEKCLGWRKIILEKPFGSDLQSAQKLNSTVGRVFHENQIYRIDHYLAKETVQNILVFRFGNVLFEPLWNRDCIDYVEINIAEDFGVRHRGAYYEQAGLIRDIIQNHGLQLLSLIAMEPPSKLEADAIRDEKVKIFKALKGDEAVTGQYEGYTKEQNVAPDSRVETFAAIKFYVNKSRWKGVPFYMRAGKNLKRAITEITLHFKHPTHELFGHTEEHVEANQLIIQIQPQHKISILFVAKRPGGELITDPVALEFDYKESFSAEGLSPYHKLLLDAMEGDQTRFIRKDGVEESWKIVDNIREKIKDIKPAVYPVGSWGPEKSYE